MKCSRCKNDADGISKLCQICREKSREYQRNYSRENSNLLKEKYKVYYKENKKSLIEKQKEYARKNPDVHKKASKTYSEKNRVNLNEKSKKYIKENSDRRKLTQKNYRDSNKEKIKQHTKEYRTLNPDRIKQLYRDNIEKILLNAKNQKYKRRKAEGKISLDEWNSILDKYGHKCLMCGRSDVKLTIDHVIPISRGGKNLAENIQPLCSSCNSSKHNKILDFRPFGSVILEWT